MTDSAPTLVVFGIDAEGKPRAARFAERDAVLAMKAATSLRYRIARISEQVVVDALPEGNVFARGNNLVKLVRQSIFDTLCAFVDGVVTAPPEQRGSR